MEEVTGPIYGYRIYLTRRMDDDRVCLTPLYFQYLDEEGGASPHVHDDRMSEYTPIDIDLFGWTHSDVKPLLDSDYHTWTVTNPSDGVIEDVEDWTPINQSATWGDFDASERLKTWLQLRAGIHVFKELRHAKAYSHSLWSGIVARTPVRMAVLAKVELAGEIVEHENGYRAEMSRIVELMAPVGPEMRSNLAERLGWPFDITHPGEPE